MGFSENGSKRAAVATQVISQAESETAKARMATGVVGTCTQPASVDLEMWGTLRRPDRRCSTHTGVVWLWRLHEELLSVVEVTTFCNTECFF